MILPQEVYAPGTCKARGRDDNIINYKLKMLPMWRSLGDKWDLVRHDNEKSPRKIKTNIVMIIVLVVSFILGSYTFNEYMQPLGTFYRYIPFIIDILAVLLCCVLAVLKWIKNDKEIDMLLLAAIILLSINSYLSYNLAHDITPV